MSAHMRKVNPGGNRVFMGTLTGGVLLHDGLAEVARTHGVQTATFELLGGLSEAEFSAYDFRSQTRLPGITLTGALEICAGHGTISLMPDETLHIHSHLMLAWRDGEAIRTAGGHCSRAVAFAVEFTLTAYDGAPMHRAQHAETGLLLWDCTGD
jgi:predicted DNA-binding protein with PD1-like motif